MRPERCSTALLLSFLPLYAAAAEALLASGAEVIAWDRQPHAREVFEGRCRLIDPLELDLTGFAGVVVSPGVPLNNHPIGPHTWQYGLPVIGDLPVIGGRPSGTSGGGR